MVISVEHSLDQQEAKRKIDNLLNQLTLKDFPGGVKIKNPEKSWGGNTMNFSFKAKRGLLGVTISGNIQMQPGKVTLTSKLPGMVTSFVSEEKIKEVIEKEAKDLLK